MMKDIEIIQESIKSKNKIVEINTKSSDVESLKCIEELKKRGIYKNINKYKYYFVNINSIKNKATELMIIRRNKNNSIFTFFMENGRTFDLGADKKEFELLANKISSTQYSTSGKYKNQCRYLKFRETSLYMSGVILIASIIFYFLKIEKFSFNNINKIGLIALSVTAILSLQDAMDVMSKSYSKVNYIFINRVLVILEAIYFALLWILIFMNPYIGQVGEELLTFLPIIFSIAAIILKIENMKANKK